MLIRDNDSVLRDKYLISAELEREKIHSWIKDQLAGAIYLENTDNDPTNFEKRMGRALPVQEVEKRLKKIIPNLHFEHTANPTKKYLVFIHPDGSRDRLMLYESGAQGLIPERSIMQAVIKETLDPSVVRGTFHIDRKDLPKHEVQPHEFNEKGELKQLGGVHWDDTVPLLGMRRSKVPWSEAIRGYRTIAAFLVMNGLTTPTAVESVFGADHTAEWQNRMGRGVKVTPW